MSTLWVLHAILAFVLISYCFDEPSWKNFFIISVCALLVLGTSPTASSWGIVTFCILSVLALVLSPLPKLLREVHARYTDQSAKDNVNTSGVGDQLPADTSENPYPMDVLHDPLGAVVDIVAVHGLGSRSASAWTHKKSKKNWLADFLPQDEDIPPARIIAFHHNSVWEHDALDKDLYDHGTQFFEALKISRNSEETKDRPLLLIGYSFGGLIVKQALVIAKDDERQNCQSLSNSLAGVIFLGTPHAGSHYTTLGKLLAHLRYWDGASTQLLGYVEYNSAKARQLEDVFSRAYSSPGITMDYVESRLNTIIGLPAGLVVSKFSATVPGRDWQKLDANHFELNRFDNENNANYLKIKAKIEDMVKKKLEKDKKEEEEYEESCQQLLRDLDPSPQKRPTALPIPTVRQSICDRKQFQDWESGKRKVLWLFGDTELNIAGFIREKYETGDKISMHFTFQSDTEFISLRKFYPTLLCQLLRKIPRAKKWLRRECFEVVRKEWGGGDSGRLQGALKKILSKMSPVLLIVDAVDECDNGTSMVELRSWLSTIAGLPNLRTVLTSNPDTDIESLANSDDFLQLHLGPETDGAKKTGPQPDGIGIKIWHNPTNAIVDVCFVHGLSGDRSSTWTAPGQADPWPKLLLPDQLSAARILTYGYDIYVSRGLATESDRLNDLGRNLMTELSAERYGTNTLTRPIIFVAHSLGGLLCKEAILSSRHNTDQHLENVFDCTKGIIFMGTPHEGSWITDWKGIRARDLGMRKFPSKCLMAILATDNPYLEKIQRDFGSMVRRLREEGEAGNKIEVMCYYEQEPSPRLNRRIVTKTSATFKDYNCVSIRADHCGMVQFDSAEDRGFKLVLGDLSRWTEQISRKSTTLSEDDRHFLSSLNVSVDQVAAKAGIEFSAGGLLGDVYKWILKNEAFVQWWKEESNRLLWIKGDPGKGKTMLLCGILEHLKSHAAGFSVSYFFCQETDSKMNNATAVLRGLIHMLLDSQRGLIADIREEHQMWLGNSVGGSNSFQRLKEIMGSILEHPRLQEAYFVIDALDECTDERPNILKLIRDFSNKPKIKWIVSSRNVIPVEEHLETIGKQKVMLSLELNQASVSTAVAAFIEHKVTELTELKGYSDSTRKAVQDYLSENADNTFLWVALVCKRLKEIHLRVTTSMKEFPTGLGPLYDRMLQQVSELQHADLCEPVLRHMAAVYDPPFLQELVSITVELEDLPLEEVPKVIQLCGSFLTMRRGKIYFVHQSAKDFLVSEKCALLGPAEGLAAAHQTILERSLSRMDDTLKYNMYTIRPGTLAFGHDQTHQTDEDETNEDDEIKMDDQLASIEYSCLFWADHACAMTKILSENSLPLGPHLSDDGQVLRFLRRHFLHWIEYLSHMESIPESILAIRNLLAVVPESPHQAGSLDGNSRSEDIRPQDDNQETNTTLGLRSFLNDAEKFVSNNRPMIDEAPLQIYGGALVFCPDNSITKRLFWELRLPFIRKVEGIDDEWDSCFRTLEAGARVLAVAFSSNGSLIAVGSTLGEIQIWEVALGIPQQGRNDFDFAGAKYSERLIAFSPQDNDDRLAYACRGGGFNVWHLPSDAITQFFDPSSLKHNLNILEFSPDGVTVAAAFNSYRLGDPSARIELWDTATKKCQTLECESHITSLSFAPGGETLAAASTDGMIRIWRPSGRPVLEHTFCLSTFCLGTFSLGKYPKYIRFSADAKTLTSLSKEGALGHWNVSTGEYHKADVDWHFDYSFRVFRAVGCYSGLLAAISDKGEVRIWYPNTSLLRHILGLESATAVGVALSPNGNVLATWESDSIKLWNISGTSTKKVPGQQNARHAISSLAFSPDGKQYASASLSQTIDIWDAATGAAKMAIKTEGNVYALAFSPDGSLLASSSLSSTTFYSTMQIRKLDGATYNLLPTSMEVNSRTHALTFLDNARLAIATHNITIVWNLVDNHVDEEATDVMKLSESYMAHEDWNVGPQSVDDAVNPRILTGEGGYVMGVNWGHLLPEAAKTRARRDAQVFVCDQRGWVTLDGEDVLWLPPDYRPRCSAIHDNLLILGQDSGQITRLHFDPSRR